MGVLMNKERAVVEEFLDRTMLGRLADCSTVRLERADGHSERWGWALCLLRRGMRLGNDGVTAGVPYISLAPEDERIVVF